LFWPNFDRYNSILQALAMCNAGHDVHRSIDYEKGRYKIVWDHKKYIILSINPFRRDFELAMDNSTENEHYFNLVFKSTD
jgi:hypothetical protein